MKKYNLNNLDVNVFEHVCKNGLRVYLIPRKDIRSFYATFNVKYGSNILKFKLNDETIEIPKGTAHFLEHKMFEQESGETPFDFYASRGLDCNASTNNSKTNYLFSGNDFFEESLNYLLDYVQKPYFTDENVQKEKGIIEQEILMYEDEPCQKLYDKSFFNTYSNHSIRYSVGGTVSDIKKITKDILDKTYQAFYRPDNMFLVISGNFDIKKAIKIIDKNQNEKTFPEVKVEVVKEEEPLEVYKKREEFVGNVYISKFALNFKIPVKNLNEKISKWPKYLFFYLESVLGSTSKLKEELMAANLIASELGFDIVKADDYCSILITGETDRYDEVIEAVLNALKKYKFNQKEFILNKKALKSSYVYMSDNIYSLNSLIAGQLIEYDKINQNIYLDVDKMNQKEYNDVVSQVDFDNYSVVVIKKTEKK
ncbi:MAG: insulinase family protein [Bacilli bacterium]|nr:insulinase family protein [Bacilli bacterium]